MADDRKKINRQVKQLLQSGSNVMGLRLCFHDHLRRAGQLGRWCNHSNPACLSVKKEHQLECAAFCGERVAYSFGESDKGIINTCPFGHTDLAAPVRTGGMLGGVLFAGVCWTKEAAPPREGMIVLPSRKWLENRLEVLEALAAKLAGILAPAQEEENSRRERIISFIESNLHETVQLSALAEELKLSASRTGHLVKEIFKETFPQLVLRQRLLRASRLLIFSDRQAGDIALATGFSDQSHFTRSFTTFFGISPTKYRTKHASEI